MTLIPQMLLSGSLQYPTPEIPTFDGGPFEGNFSNGGDYWLNGFNYGVSDFASASSLVSAVPAVASIVDVGAEGYALQVANSYRIISDRGWHPVVTGQNIRLTIRTRLTADVTSGDPHWQLAYVAGIAQDGSYAGYSEVVRWSGLTVADGWVDRVVTFNPRAKEGTQVLGTNLKGWRLMLGLNGFPINSTAGAIQQFSSITIEEA